MVHKWKKPKKPFPKVVEGVVTQVMNHAIFYSNSIRKVEILTSFIKFFSMTPTKHVFFVFLRLEWVY